MRSHDTCAEGARPPEDERWMRLALALAERGAGKTSPNPPVGAVVVRNGRVCGRGFHRRAGEPHAEALALRDAGSSARGSTIYVTLEPCCTTGRTGPCTEAILAAGIERVVAAVRDPNPRHNGRGLKRLRSAGLCVTEGVCDGEAGELIRPFGRWIRTGIPYVTLKLAVTLDGRIADSFGRSRWLSCPASREIVRRMRLRSDAVMIGGATAAADNSKLLTGRKHGHQPLRIVVDSKGGIPPGLKLLNDDFVRRTVVATTARCPQSRRAMYRAKGAEVIVTAARDGRVSLKSLLRALGKRGITSVLCEGGGRLAGSLIAEGLVDEIVMFHIPRFLGERGRPAVGGRNWSMRTMPGFTVKAVRRVGTDTVTVLSPLRSGRM